MNTISTKPSGRSLRCLLLLTLFLIGLQVDRSHANTLTVEPVSSNGCGSTRCCYQIDFTASAATTDITIKTLGNPGCWDWICFGNQTPTIVDANNSTVTLTAVTANGITVGYTLTFNPGLAVGATVRFWLCPKDPLPAGCTIVNSTYQWWSYNGGVGNGSGSGTFNACGSYIADCLGCDQTIIYRINDCYHQVCYKRRATGGETGHTIRFTFSPCLERNCTPLCAGYTSSVGIPTGWTATTVFATGSTTCIDHIDLTWSGHNVAACDEICLTIATCGLGPTTVRAKDMNDSLTCETNPSSMFKTGSGNSASDAVLSGSGNYPNPVTSTTNFRTVVPFSIPASSDARITFMDVSGKVVHTESQTFAGAGKHFFYFTASDLPSGTYYYTIESPLGFPIVKRNLLIVK